MAHPTHNISAVLLLLLAACSSEPEFEPLAAAPMGLEDAEMNIPSGNPMTPAKAELGKMLFFDTRLSSNGKMSCSTCHLHEHGWADGKKSSTKVDGTENTRNSPSLYNTGYQLSYYWDGRKDTMEGNVMAAWEGHMGGDPQAMAKTLNGIEGYKKAFDAAFVAGGATGDRIVQALCTFVRTLRSGDSPYDQGTMSEDAKEGLKLFEARCAACHTKGTGLFMDHLYHNVGIGMKAEKPDIGRGKIDKNWIGAFKTPTLRSVAKTAPYFHDGSVATLREAVAIMSSGGLDNEHLDPILKGHKKKGPMTDKQVDQLVAFLEALTSTETFEPPVLPK